MKPTPDATDRVLNRLLLIGVPVVLVALLLLAVSAAYRSQALEMQQFLHALTARDVTCVEVVAAPAQPVSQAAPIGPASTTLTNPIAINQLLTAYQRAVPYGPGGGRFSDGWEVQVDFHLRTGRVIRTTAFQNNLTCLLFIASPTHRSASNPEDCLMSQAAGRLLVQLTQPAR